MDAEISKLLNEKFHSILGMAVAYFLGQRAE